MLRQLASRPARVILLFLLTLLSLVALGRFNVDQMNRYMTGNYGDDGAAILNAWQQMMASSESLGEQQKLEAVNRFFNRNIQWGDDRLLYKSKDFWATPLETLGIRAGDCEDFTIAKYTSLLALGLNPNKLRLIYVKAKLPSTGRDQAHMVLGYYSKPSAIPYILDNINPNILPASKRGDLKPVFSFNSEGLWVAGRAQKQDPTARLSRWRSVIARMQEQGMDVL